MFSFNLVKLYLYVSELLLQNLKEYKEQFYSPQQESFPKRKALSMKALSQMATEK